jgi:hypothetical protein
VGKTATREQDGRRVNEQLLAARVVLGDVGAERDDDSNRFFQIEGVARGPTLLHFGAQRVRNRVACRCRFAERLSLLHERRTIRRKAGRSNPSDLFFVGCGRNLSN